MKECYLYEKLSDEKVKCLTCNHYCLILPGKRGICGVRENQAGTLFALNYGKVVALNIDPIEKKPFFHFLPGSQSLSVATVGCNFRCKNCQNWEISQASKQKGVEAEEIKNMGENLPPTKIVEEALKYKLPSISYTYTEPTIFLEYALDTMKLAKEKGLKNNWVTNGYMSKETLDLISPYLDAANVDLKSFEEKFYQEVCGAKLKPVLDNLIEMKERKIWFEITTLIIPTLSDDLKMLEKIAKFIKEKLGEETPWHISRFSPKISFKLQNLPETPPEIIHQARKIGLKIGLKYVYAGNLWGNEAENTYCPKCSEIVIKRFGYSTKRLDKNGKCSRCNERLNIVE